MRTTVQQVVRWVGVEMVEDSVPAEEDRPAPLSADRDLERETFESLLKPILGRVYRAAMSLSGSQADAEDLVQEAALTAYRRFETFAPGTNFRAWFLRILTNAFYMKARRDRRMTSALAQGARSESLPAPSAAKQAQTPAGVLARKLAIEQMTRAIQALPPEYRTVATLYFVEDLSYRDIAAIVECPIGTVRSRLHRGRKLLQAMLWRTAKDHGVI